MAEFLETFPEAEGLRQELDEYVARLTHDLSGAQFPNTEEGKYLVYLLVTYARSHMIVSDLIAVGDLVDAATLTRRQMEVMSRLHEVRATPDLATLMRKTPNVGRPQTQVRRMYGEYTGIAHASNPVNMQLFGRGVDSELVALYPRFTEHAYVSLQHLALLVLELWVWATTHFEELGLRLDREWHEAWLQQATPRLGRVP